MHYRHCQPLQSGCTTLHGEESQSYGKAMVRGTYTVWGQKIMFVAEGLISPRRRRHTSTREMTRPWNLERARCQRVFGGPRVGCRPEHRTLEGFEAHNDDNTIVCL